MIPKRWAVRRGQPAQRKVRDAIASAAAEPIAGALPSRLELRTVTTCRTGTFDRHDFYDDHER